MYNGSGRYIERNDADRRVVIEARARTSAERNGNRDSDGLIRREAVDRPTSKS
jgi:hypothetical protein